MRQEKRKKTFTNVKERYIHNDRLNVYSVALPHYTSHRTLGAINEHSINSHMHESAVHIVPQKSFPTHNTHIIYIPFTMYK